MCVILSVCACVCVRVFGVCEVGWGRRSLVNCFTLSRSHKIPHIAHLSCCVLCFPQTRKGGNTRDGEHLQN